MVSHSEHKNSYVIKDVWMALRKSGKVFAISMCFIWLTSLFILGGR